MTTQLKIGGRDVYCDDKGRVLIDRIRFRDWFLRLNKCPFCGRTIGLKEFACKCAGWRDLMTFTKSQPTKEPPKQTQLPFAYREAR